MANPNPSLKYLVYGEDSYRAREFIQSVTQNRHRIVDRWDVVNINLLLVQQPELFNHRPWVIWRNLLGELKKEKERIVRVRQPTILWEEVSNLNEKDLKPWRSQFEVKQFRSLSRKEVLSWIMAQAKSLRLQLTPQILQKLVEWHGSNLFLLQHEIQKIYHYLRGKQIQTLNLDDLVQLSPASIEGNIFDLLDAIGKRDLTLIRRSLRSILHAHIDEWYLFYMISKHIRYLNQHAQQVQYTAHPFVKGKIAQQVLNWEPARLMQKMQDLLEIEYRVKKGIGSLKPELLNWIFQI